MPTFERTPQASPSVLTFLHSFEPGGVERIALRLVQHWQKEGARVSLFMSRTEGAMERQFAGAVNFTRAPETRLPIRHFETLWMIVQLACHLRKNPVDMLFAAGNSYAVVAIAMKWLLGCRCPTIILKISNDLVRPDMWKPYAFFYRIWLRMQGRWIDRFIAMSDALADQIGCELHVPHSRIEIIANPSLGARQTVSARRNDVAGPIHSFCAVGRLTRQKNFPAMLRAFAAGSRADDRLTLYGDGPKRPRLEKLAGQLGISDRVEFAGFVAEPSQILPHHHVLLLSSQFEGLPSVVLEAMDAGLHIIATDCCCSMKWLLDSGKLGDLVDATDESAFARAIANAPRGQRAPKTTAAKADEHRIGKIAPTYLRFFEAVSVQNARPPISLPPTSTLETGFAQ